MALIALEAFREAGAPLELTVADRCETPLALSRWSAERTGAVLQTPHVEILAFKSKSQFDVVMTSSFLAFIGDAARPRLFALWASLLRPGGKLLFTNRLRPGATAAPVGFSADQARKFCARARREAERCKHTLGLDPAMVEAWARSYTEKLKAFPLRSVDDVMAFLKAAGFAPDCIDTAPVPGAPGGDNVSGPSAADRGDYVRVLATRV
jgi:SAM-dependent methyltransferase